MSSYNYIKRVNILTPKVNVMKFIPFSRGVWIGDVEDILVEASFKKFSFLQELHGQSDTINI